MDSKDLDSLVEIVRSGDTAESVQALERILEVFNQVLHDIIDSLENHHNQEPLFVMERLHLFGSITIPHFEELYNNATGEEIKVLTAIALLLLNNKTGVQYLLKRLSYHGEHDFLITYKLVNANIREAIPIIENRLQLCRPDEVDRIVCFLEALFKLNRKIPSNLRNDLADSALNQLQSTDLENIHTIIKNLEILRLLDRDLPVQVHNYLSASPSLHSILETFTK